MRFLPLLSSLDDPSSPSPWPADAELVWQGGLHEGWRSGRRSVHALHLPELPLGPALLAAAGEALRQGLGPDFLVIPVRALPDRATGFALLGVLESLLEAVQGRVKVVLHLEPDIQASVLRLLREARAEAVGFCWSGGDPEPLADRLWCAVGSEGLDLEPLRATGYRWNVALPVGNLHEFQRRSEALAKAHPPVLFPAVMPETALGRPIVADPSVTFGAAWER